MCVCEWRGEWGRGREGPKMISGKSCTCHCSALLSVAAYPQPIDLSLLHRMIEIKGGKFRMEDTWTYLLSIFIRAVYFLILSYGNHYCWKFCCRLKPILLVVSVVCQFNGCFCFFRPVRVFNQSVNFYGTIIIVPKASARSAFHFDIVFHEHHPIPPHSLS